MCINSYLNPDTAFCMMDSSVLLSKTKDSAATVGPQIRVNNSESKAPVGAWRKTPSLVSPLLSNTCIKNSGQLTDPADLVD